MAQYEITNDPAKINFEIAEDDVIDRILQNCHNLLMIRMGEIPFNRNRGTDQRIFDLPVSEMESVLSNEMNRVMGWEERVSVVSARAEMTEDLSIRIHVVVDIDETNLN